MLSIRWKIILFNTLLTGAMLIAFAVILYQSVERYRIARLDSQLEQYAAGIERTLAGNLEDGDFADSADFNELKAEGPQGIQYVLFDNNGKPQSGTLHLSISLKQRNGFFFQTIDNRSWRCLKAALEDAREKDYSLIAAAPLEDIRAGSRYLIFLFSILIPGCLLLSALVSWLIIKIAFRPLSRIIETAQIISASSLDSRLQPPKARDEIQKLTQVLNEMLSRLSTAFTSQRQFVADASHEIRTPLAIIRSELEFMQRFTLDKEVRGGIETALTEITRLTGLAEALLMLARLDAGQIVLDVHPVRVDELLLETARQMKSLAEKKGISISVKTPGTVSIKADPEKLRRILLNLLDNAVKFSPDNSTVTMALESNDKTAAISISDNGPGIPAGELEKIFKRFYRSESVRGDKPGSGLGLAIAEQLVQLHGGSISVESLPGKSTTFFIKLPIA